MDTTAHGLGCRRSVYTQRPHLNIGSHSQHSHSQGRHHEKPFHLAAIAPRRFCRQRMARSPMLSSILCVVSATAKAEQAAADRRPKLSCFSYCRFLLGRVCATDVPLLEFAHGPLDAKLRVEPPVEL